MRILADADFLVALSKEDDINHKKALEKAMLLKDALIFTTPFTIREAATVISYKVSQKSAKKFLESACQRNFIEISLDKEIIEEADFIFLSQAAKGTSWVDCLNIAVTRKYQLDGILSFDRFYQRQGIKLI